VKFKPVYLLLGVAAAVIVMAIVATGGDTPGSVRKEGAVITKIVSKIEPDATAVFQIALQEGGDAEHESAHIFQQFEHPAIASVALDTEALTLTINYDSAGTSETALRSQLATTGYIARSAEDGTPTQMASDGSSQTIHLVPGDALTPSLVHAEPGVPLTITFSPGTGHLTSVTIPKLGLSQTLAAEGASITIPSPEVGQYELVCAEGYSDAIILVE
jgi:hypothetical protein